MCIHSHPTHKYEQLKLKKGYPGFAKDQGKQCEHPLPPKKDSDVIKVQIPDLGYKK